MSPIIYLGIRNRRRNSDSLAGTPLAVGGLVIIVFFAFAPFLSRNADTKQASTSINAKSYSTKVNKISETNDHYWLIEGTSKAPNNSKIMLTATDKDNFNYGNQEGESVSGNNFAKVKDGKFKVVADPIDINNADTGKAEQTTKVAIFATDKVKGDWTDGNLPKSWQDKKFKPVTLTMSQSQADYMNDGGDEDTSSSQFSESSSSNENSKDTKRTGFDEDLNTYLSNQYNDATSSLNKDLSRTTIIVPDEVAFMNKTQQKAYVNPIYQHLETFAAANDLKTIPQFTMQTSNGNNVARSSFTGFKVYADD